MSWTAAGSVPSARAYLMPGRLESAACVHPGGVRTLIPIPLSSQTIRSGSGSPWYAQYDAVLSAPAAVEWLTDASPMLAITTESAGHGAGWPRRAARGSARARPTALGRCEAIVDVCGMTFSRGCPKTLCRPPAIGSAAAATIPSRTSLMPSVARPA